MTLATLWLHGQTPDMGIRVNESFYKTPLSKVLKTIETKYGVKIAYDNALVQNVVVALDLKDLDITQTMERLVQGTPLAFHYVGNNVVIIPRPPSERRIVTESNFDLSGKVIDAETEETLPQATLRIPGTGIATVTNNDGYFILLDIPADTMSVEIRYLGYISQVVPIRELLAKHNGIVRLGSDRRLLNEVVVFDEYNQALHVEAQAGSVVFNPRSLSTLPSLGEQDVFRTLQLLPGVGVTDESSSGMIIRGSHSGYNLTSLDGMTIYQQDHFFGAFSIINSDVIKDVQVHKGLFDAKYGGRVSGMADITTKNGNAVRPAFDIKANLINVKATAEIPIGKKWSLFAGARRSLTDIAQPDLFTELFNIASSSNGQIRLIRFVEFLGGEALPAYYFFDTNTKLTFRPTTRDNISLSFYASRDRMNVLERSSTPDFDVENNEFTGWGNNGLSLRWARQWNDRYYSNLRISNSRFFRRFRLRQEVDADVGSSMYRFSYDNGIDDLSYAFENEWQLGNTLSVEFGLSGTRQNTDAHFWDQYRFSGEFPPDEIPEDSDLTEVDESWQHSIFGSLSFTPIKRLYATAGLRVVHFQNGTGALYAEPRLKAGYVITDQLNLKAAYGRNHQFITQQIYQQSDRGPISDLYENFWMLSEPDPGGYPVIRSDHVSGGTTLKGKYLLFDGEIYFKRNADVMIDEYLNSGITNDYGLDLMIQKTSGIHKGWIAYSLSRSTQRHPYINGGAAAPAWQDQRHELKVVDMLILGKWVLSSTLIYGSGKPYPKYDVTYHRDDNGFIYDYSLMLDHRNESRLPAYFRFDLAATYQWSMGKTVDAEVGLSIHNLTDHKNVKMRRIDTRALDATLPSETEPTLTHTDVVLLGFSPTLSFHLSF
jgi:hypothetical protein